MPVAHGASDSNAFNLLNSSCPLHLKLEVNDCPEFVSCSCLMATPRVVNVEEAKAHWERFSDEVRFSHEMSVAEQVCRGIQYLQQKGAAFEAMAFERDKSSTTSTSLRVKRNWIQLDQQDKITHLTRLLTKDTSWQIYISSKVLHEFASDTEDILNPELFSLFDDDQSPSCLDTQNTVSNGRIHAQRSRRGGGHYGHWHSEED